VRPDRPHQARALEQISAAWRRGRRNPLLVMPTGAGKTHVGLRAVDLAVQNGKRVLWLVHREELWKQPRDRILEDGWPPEQLQIVAGGRRHGAPDAPLTIASIQTLTRWSGDQLPPADLLICDEARHYVAKSWASVPKAYAHARRLGLDATPIRSDGTPLGDIFDDLVVPTSVAELVEAGLLVPSTVWAPPEYQEELAEDPVDAYFRLCPGAIAVAFCRSVGHARLLAEAFRAAGIPAASVDAKTPENERERAFKDLGTGAIRVLTNVRIATEGTDVPAIEAVIHAAPCVTLGDWIQKGGRGLRPNPATAKTGCLVLDLHGSIHLGHGLLDDPHEFTLHGEGMRLPAALPPIASCPRCFAWARSMRRCPQCGHEVPAPPVKPARVRAADLQEVRRGESPTRKWERLGKWVLDEMRAGVAEGLRGHELTRRAFRAAHRYEGTYGEKPARDDVLSAIDRARIALADTEAAQTRTKEPLFAARGGA
jgi:DNA repair protein RadD